MRLTEVGEKKFYRAVNNLTSGSGSSQMKRYAMQSIYESSFFDFVFNN